MKYLKTYQIFESIINGQDSGFDNQSILDDIQDMLIELEDIGVNCRIWTNRHRALNTIKYKTTLSEIEIEVNYDGIDNIEELSDPIINRIKKYLGESWAVQISNFDEFFYINCKML